MTMLFAYQGMGNLVTLTDPKTGGILYNALIDFGTTSYYECDETVEFSNKFHRYVSYFRGDPGWRDISTKKGQFTTYISLGTDRKSLGAEKRRVVFRIKADATFGVSLVKITASGLL
jgi:hypothetical protein